jgi:hypothetical protein
MAWITADMVRWLSSLKKLKQQDLERIVGLDTSMPDRSPEVRQAGRRLVITKSLTFVLLLVVVSGLITVSLAIATIRAFSGAL